MPFSSGLHVCTGAGFAMIEGVTLLAMLVRHFKFEVVPEKTLEPVAHLAVRARDGIWLRFVPRNP